MESDRASDRAVVCVADPGGLVDRAAQGRIETWVVEATARLGIGGEVRVRLVGDAEMAAAHERFSGVAGTTDVLTFDLRPESEKQTAVMDVDILACVDEARRQAAARGHALEHELILYVVHGMLHCMGHDDHDDAAYARMHALEDDVLAAIGVGRVFSAEPAGGAA